MVFTFLLISPRSSLQIRLSALTMTPVFILIAVAIVSHYVLAHTPFGHHTLALGDNENAIEIQIWSAMLANLLITLVKSKINRKWAFSNMVSIIRQQLMNYINIYAFLEEPERSWLLIIKEEKNKYQYSLFPQI